MTFESAVKNCTSRNASPISPISEQKNEKINEMVGKREIWLGVDAGAWSQQRKKLNGEISITIEGVKRVFNYRAYQGTIFFRDHKLCSVKIFQSFMKDKTGNWQNGREQDQFHILCKGDKFSAMNRIV